MNALPERWSADDNVSDARLGSFADVHDQPIYAAHRLIISVDELFIENIVYDFHVSYPETRGEWR
jgi:hypothetical protein